MLDHPVHELGHASICDGSLEKARGLRLDIDLTGSHFESHVTKAECLEFAFSLGYC